MLSGGLHGIIMPSKTQDQYLCVESESRHDYQENLCMCEYMCLCTCPCIQRKNGKTTMIY